MNRGTKADVECAADVTSERRGWLIATAVLALAWALAFLIVRLQVGPMDNPDDFSPFPPLSFYVAAIVLVPATLTFVTAAAGRAAYLAWRAIRSGGSSAS